MDVLVSNYIQKLSGPAIRKALVLFLLLLPVSVHGEIKRVLFIGNSYTLGNNLPQITANIASSMGDQLIYSISAISGYSLKQHYSDATTLNLIRQGGWDYVVLQEFSRYPSEPLAWVEANVYPYARNLNSEIIKYNPSAETMFYMTWGRRDGDADRCATLPEVCTYIGMDNLTRDRYMYMAQSNQAVVSPVGAVWRNIRGNYPSIELYETDGSHPSPAGSYAAACCFYTAIFRKDPGLIKYNFSIDPAVAAQIRNAARVVVYYNLRTWYIGDYDYYTIGVNAGIGGTINPSGNQYVKSGDNITFNITTGIGHRILDVKVDNNSVGTVTSYTFRNISSNHTISVTFTPIIFSINASAGSGGSIKPSGTVPASFGSVKTFDISADRGYGIEDLIVDNVSVGSRSKYVFNQITSDHTIRATFKPLTFNITGTSGNGGSISPNGTVTLNYGDNQVYTFLPDIGFQIEDVIVDNVSVGKVTSYSFKNVTSQHSIYASFTPITYTIQSMSGSGGSLNPSGNVSVNYGKDAHFIIIPDENYKVSSIMVDYLPAEISSDNFLISNVTRDHILTVAFTKLETYTLIAGSGKNGSIYPTGDTLVTEGSDQTYYITPSPGYRISNVFVDAVPMGPVPEYTFQDISGDHSISAVFTAAVKPDIYPNPFRDEFTIIMRSPYEYQYKVSLFTLNNRIVFVDDEIPANTEFIIKPDIPPGIYVLNVYHKGKKVASARVVKY